MNELRYALLIWLCACTPVLPPPHMPLVPTPNEQFRAAAPNAEAEPDFAEPDVARSSLANGLKLAVAEVPDAPYIEVVVVIPHALPSTLASLLALSLNGAASRDAKQLRPLAVVAERTAVLMHWRCEASSLEAAIAAAAARIAHPPAASTVNGVQRRLHTGVAFFGPGPEHELLRILRASVSHAQELEASRQLNEWPAYHLARAFAGLLQPDHLTLVVAGAGVSNAVPELASRHLGGLQPLDSGAVPGAGPDTWAFSRDRAIKFVRASVAAPVIGFAFGVSVDQQHRVDVELLSSMLGGKVSSLLNARLRELSGLTYGVHTTVEPSQNGAILYGMLAVDATRLNEALAELVSSFTQLGQIEQADMLAQAVQSAKVQLALQVRRADLTAERLVEEASLDPSLHGLAWRRARLDSITAQDIQRLAQRWLVYPQFVVLAPREMQAVLQWNKALTE